MRRTSIVGNSPRYSATLLTMAVALRLSRLTPARGHMKLMWRRNTGSVHIQVLSNGKNAHSHKSLNIALSRTAGATGGISLIGWMHYYQRRSRGFHSLRVGFFKTRYG